jgi:hypothetical protein
MELIGERHGRPPGQRSEDVRAGAVDDRYDDVKRELAKWLQNRHDIAEAYLTLRDGGFLFLVVT